MAIGTPVSLGTPVTDTENQLTTIALTTNVTVPSGAELRMAVSWYNISITASMGSTGGLTWTLDKQQDGTVDTGRHLAIFSASAPSGLASGTALTATFSGSGAFGRGIFGCYFTGGLSASPLDGTPAGAVGTVVGWSPGSITLANTDSIEIAAAWFDGVNTTETAVTGTELLDFNNALNASWAMLYRLPGSSGSQSISGTWASASGGGTPEWASVMAAYKASGGGGSTIVSPLMTAGPAYAAHRAASI